MGAVTWVEVLGRYQEVSQRHRFSEQRLRVGRAYDNDVVLDDAAVAPHHAEITCLPDGQYLVRDLGSVNGTWQRGPGQRRELPVGDAPIDGHTVLRLGRMQLRLRDADFAVEPERKLSADELSHAWGLAVVALVCFLSLEALYHWLRLADNPKLINFLQPLSVLVGGLLSWAAVWGIINRVFAGQARFDRHLLIGILGLLVSSALDEVLSYISYAWVLQVPGHVSQALSLLLGACFIFLHLRVVSPVRPLLKAGLIGLMTLATGSIQYVAGSEQASSYGDASSSDLKPPFLQWRAPHEMEQVLQGLDRLRDPLDRSRQDEPGDDDLDEEE